MNLMTMMGEPGWSAQTFSTPGAVSSSWKTMHASPSPDRLTPGQRRGPEEAKERDTKS